VVVRDVDAGGEHARHVAADRDLGRHAESEDGGGSDDAGRGRGGALGDRLHRLHHRVLRVDHADAEVTWLETDDFGRVHEDTLRAAIAEVVAQWGGFDLFVANAGVLRAGSVLEQTAEETGLEGALIERLWIEKLAAALLVRPTRSLGRAKPYAPV